MEIHGNCDPAFSAVRDAFEQNFADGLELGAAAAVTVDGEALVDIWAGTEPRTREWRAAEIPAAGGLGNARSIAAVHSMLANGGEVNGVRLLSEAGARRALEPQIDGVDEVLMLRLRHGLGFALEMEGWVNSPNPNHMFWGGWGGSLATVDFDARMTVSYVMNRMDAELTGDPRGGRLVNASYASL